MNHVDEYIEKLKTLQGKDVWSKVIPEDGWSTYPWVGKDKKHADRTSILVNFKFILSGSLHVQLTSVGLMETKEWFFNKFNLFIWAVELSLRSKFGLLESPNTDDIQIYKDRVEKADPVWLDLRIEELSEFRDGRTFMVRGELGLKKDALNSKDGKTEEMPEIGESGSNENPKNQREMPYRTSAGLRAALFPVIRRVREKNEDVSLSVSSTDTHLDIRAGLELNYYPNFLVNNDEKKTDMTYEVIESLLGKPLKDVLDELHLPVPDKQFRNDLIRENGVTTYHSWDCRWNFPGVD